MNDQPMCQLSSNFDANRKSAVSDTKLFALLMSSSPKSRGNPEGNVQRCRCKIPFKLTREPSRSMVEAIKRLNHQSKIRRSQSKSNLETDCRSENCSNDHVFPRTVGEDCKEIWEQITVLEKIDETVELMDEGRFGYKSIRLLVMATHNCDDLEGTDLRDQAQTRWGFHRVSLFSQFGLFCPWDFRHLFHRPT